MKIESIAKICHDANRSVCEASGDTSQITWDGAPDWQRASALNGVQFHIDNPTADASASHVNWMREKLADGWTYGATKNPEQKTHPCIVPFDKLEPAQQIKDHVFKAIVHACVPFLDR